jgi:hypothetical protein
MTKNGEAIYGTSGFVATPWGAITRKGTRLFVIVTDGALERVALPLESPIRSARRLDGPAVAVDGTTLTLPRDASLARVVVVESDGEPRRAKTRAEMSAEGIPLPPEPDGSYLLRATDAALRGSILRVEEQCTEGNVGYWTDANEHVEWFIGTAGDYEVELRYAVASGAGGEFEVRAGAEALRASVGSTGGWNRFETKRLGRITARAGQVSVRPVRFSHAMMNLAHLRLVPAR